MRSWTLSVLVLSFVAVGLLGCSVGEGDEPFASTSEAISSCPVCAAWSECVQIPIGPEGATRGVCDSCGGVGEAPCSSSAPDPGCQPQSTTGPDSIAYMGTINGLCQVCGDIGEPVCDTSWQPPASEGSFQFGCQAVSQIVPASSQDLRSSSGVCAPCGGTNQTYCESALFQPLCAGGTMPSDGTCVACGSPGAPACVTVVCTGSLLDRTCTDEYSCQAGCTNVGGTCEDEYGAFAPFASAAVTEFGTNQFSPTLVVITPANYEPSDGGMDTVANLQAFGSAMAQSSVWAAVSQEYKLGTLTAAAPVNGTSLDAGSSGLSPANVTGYVSGLVSADIAPKPTGNTTYLVYVPAAVPLDTASSAGGGWGGDSCGYNMQYGSSNDAIAIARPCAPVDGNDSLLGRITQIASHEVVEAATSGYWVGAGMQYDSYPIGFYNGVPELPPLWGVWNGGGVQTGDLCEGSRMEQTIDGQTWEFQRIFSNAAAAAGGDPCIPASGDPYFSVSTPQQWFPVPAGQTVEIPVTGWAAAPVAANWFLNDDFEFSAPDSGIVLGGIDSGVGYGHGPGTNCNTHPLMSNTGSASITVTGGTCAGDYMVFEVRSFEEDQGVNCNPALSKDAYHLWPIGVYVTGGSCDCAGQNGWPTVPECQVP